MLTVQDAIAKFLSDGTGILASTAIEWYAKKMRPLYRIGDKSLDQVTGDDLIELSKGQARRCVRYTDAPQKPVQSGGLSVYTLFGMVIAWRRFFNWAVKSGLLETSPAAQFRKPPLPEESPKAILRKDMLKLMKATAKTKNPKRDYAIVRFLADTGCRVGGLVELQVGDLDLATGSATVRETGRGRKRKARTVYMNRETIRAVREYLKERGTDPGPVFLRQDGQLLESGIYQILKRLAKKKSVEIHNPHAFRHGFARGLLENGAGLATVSDLMGHEDIYVTDRFYARWNDQELKRRHAKFSWVPKKKTR